MTTLTLGIPTMPRISAAQRAFQNAYRARIIRKAVITLRKIADGLSAKDLAKALRLSPHGIDRYLVTAPDIEKSHRNGETWYRAKPLDSGYRSELMPIA